MKKILILLVLLVLVGVASSANPPSYAYLLPYFHASEESERFYATLTPYEREFNSLVVLVAYNPRYFLPYVEQIREEMSKPENERYWQASRQEVLEIEDLDSLEDDLRRARSFTRLYDWRMDYAIRSGLREAMRKGTYSHILSGPLALRERCARAMAPEPVLGCSEILSRVYRRDALDSFLVYLVDSGVEGYGHRYILLDSRMNIFAAAEITKGDIRFDGADFVTKEKL